MADKFLRIQDVRAATGLGRSTLYRLIAAGRFPKPVPVIGDKVAWLDSEVTAWQRERIAERVSETEVA